MKDKRTAIESVLGTNMLHEPPHILSQLMEIVISGWQPTPNEQEQLLEHLIECEYCQTTLAWLIDFQFTDENSNTSSVNLVQRMLARQKEGMRMKHAHYEQIAAYIETLKAQGEEEASKKFIDLVEHLQLCIDCRHLVESAQALFDEMAKGELEQETKVNTKLL